MLFTAIKSPVSVSVSSFEGISSIGKNFSEASTLASSSCAPALLLEFIYRQNSTSTHQLMHTLSSGLPRLCRTDCDKLAPMEPLASSFSYRKESDVRVMSKLEKKQ